MKRTGKKTMLILVCALMVISFHQSASACQVDEFYNTKEGFLAASTPETLNAAIKLEEEGNKERLADNARVQVLERSFEFKALKIKLPKGNSTYWVKDGSLKQIDCN